jgi:hypothetical protein
VQFTIGIYRLVADLRKTGTTTEACYRRGIYNIIGFTHSVFDSLILHI